MKPKVSIVIPTLGRESLYPLMKDLLKQKVNFNYEIVLIPQVKLKEEKLKDKKIRFYYEDLGKGFPYYRNKGIEKSRGEIVVFIDDDELPINKNWIDNITALIINKKEKVVTAGVKIKLKQGYFTDSISLLGFPGGGAIGFKTMWEVDKEGYTKHLCSGNLAIDKKLLEKINSFDLAMKSGSEDVNLAEKLIKNKDKIKYVEKATVYHVARKGFLKFVKWNFLRGKSAAEFLKEKKDSGEVGKRFSSSKRILKKTIKTKYFPGVFFMMVNQYLWQTFGYLIGRFKR
jgi:glycosyltransferase involved in cell wall biosynthesis